MTEPPAGTTPPLVDILLAQRESWLRGERPPVEELLRCYPALAQSEDAVLDLVYNERMLREEAGQKPDVVEYLGRFPQFAEALRIQFEVDQAITVEAPAPPPEAETATWPAAGPQAALPDLPGYEVQGELGRGAMGVVFRAWQRAAGRLVAVKLLSPAVPPGRVRTEAQAAARLQHPHIVQLFDVHEHAGRPALVFEYVENGNLAKRLDGKPQPPRDSARLIEGLARAMAYAHARGVVHRDLKPQNVLLASPPDTPLGACLVKISDFGLAKLLEDAPGQAGLTRTTDVLGTPSYMAPEQAGRDSRNAGPTADVYALGAILYECLTGRPPFLGEGVLDTLDQLRSQDPVPPRHLRPGVPRDLEVICLKCLHKSPTRRYASARELAEDLRAFLDGRPINARPVGPVERAAKWARRRPGLAAAGLLVLLAAAGLLGLGVYFNRQLRRERDLARLKKEESEQRLEHTRRLLYTAQLLRVGSLLDTDPLQGRRMLEDPVACPDDLRDFVWGVLHGLCQRDRAALEGHDRPVAALAFRPTGPGALLASGGHDGEVRLWDPGTARCRAVLRDHSHRITAVAFSPDGKTLASASYDETVRLYDLDPRPGARPKFRAALSAGGPVWAVTFLPDGQHLACAAGPATGAEVSVWKLSTNRRRRRLPGRVRGGCNLASSPDGRWLAAGGAERGVLVWEVSSGKLAHTLPHEGTLTAVAFAPEGQPLASAGADRKVHLWDPAEGRRLGTLEVEGGPISAVAFGATRQTLAVACDEPPDLFGAGRPRPVYLYDLHSGAAGDPLLGHRGAVASLAFSPDGKTLATGGADRLIKLWDVPGPRRRLALTGHAGGTGSVAVSGDGRSLAWASRHPGRGPTEVTVFDLAAGAVRAVLRGHTRPVRQVALSADGQTAASAAGQGDDAPELTVWDVRTARPLHQLSGHGSAVTALVFSPDSRSLYSAGWDGSVRAWGVAAGRPRYALRLGARAPVRLALSADGEVLATAADEPGKPARVGLWDAGTGAPLRELGPLDGGVSCLAFSPDGKTLAAGGGGQVQLFEVETGEGKGRFSPGVRDVACLAFSPDGKTLAVGGATPGVKLWDLATAQECASLPGHDGGAILAAFPRGGRVLVTAGAVQGARFWHSVGSKRSRGARNEE